MTVFKQKSFSEFDAMRSLYIELTKNAGPNKFQMIKLNSLLPVLKGNNVVIERFVISTGFFKRDTYRMYLKIGAKAKLPDEVRMPSHYYDKTLFNAQLNVGFDGGNNGGGGGNNQNQPRQENKSESAANEKMKIKLFGNGNKGNNGGGGGGNANGVKAGLNFPVSISYEVKELLGDAVNYDKKSRSLVLEFKTIQDAIRAINILPFGVNYKIFLLDIDS